MCNLNVNVSLIHLDVSDNHVTAITDLSHLVHLQTLLLHGNKIKTLQVAGRYLPTSLKILSLAENNLEDLNEVLFNLTAG